MAVLLQMAIAPTFICLIYLYIRDKYEKEPIRLLLTGVIYGAYSTALILALGAIAERYMTFGNTIWETLYTSFVTSAGIEETVKYIFLYFLVWRNKNFNEPFDGIVYAAFISLGFAGVENIIYVFSKDAGGLETAISRAIFSVPGHALFGTIMGYHFALAKFMYKKRVKYLIMAILIPWLLHGVYNTILLLGVNWYLMIFIPFVGFLWYTGFKKMKEHLMRSPFKKNKK